jgi:CubicO group peptidase (beta-lactamase class C family)
MNMPRAALLGAVLLLAGVARSQEPPARTHDPGLLPAARLAEIEKLVRGAVEKNGIPGLSVALVLDRKIAWADGFGQADVENGVAAASVTSYRWASVSKLVTATAVMQLVEQGRMDLEEAIQKYVPAFPDKGSKITPRLLLCHQGGIRHYKGDEARSTRAFASLQEGLALFKDDPLLFEPGTKYSYSTYGYNLLGCAVEGASGMKFTDYLRRHVFEPAGMRTARDDSARDIIAHRAQGYVRDRDGKLRNSDLADTGYKIPGGGLCGSVLDLAGFAIANTEARLLKRETLDRMWVAQKTADGAATRHGLGWGLDAYRGKAVPSHGGAQQRVSSWLILVPERGAAVALVGNLEGMGGPLARLSHEILDVALAEK